MRRSHLHSFSMLSRSIPYIRYIFLRSQHCPVKSFRKVPFRWHGGLGRKESTVTSGVRMSIQPSSRLVVLLPCELYRERRRRTVISSQVASVIDMSIYTYTSSLFRLYTETRGDLEGVVHTAHHVVQIDPGHRITESVTI